MGIIDIGHNDIIVSPSVVGNSYGIGISDVLHLIDIGRITHVVI
jgi:hypothetical protein